MRGPRRRALLVLALGALAGCAGLELGETAGAPDFELQGRIAVRHGDEASSGQILWRHRADADDLLISTPLGQGVARIVRREGRITLTTQSSDEYHAEDAEALTERVLGYRIPLRGLSEWVRGRAAPGPALETRDADGRLRQLQQQGWFIEYLAYDAEGQRPVRMRLAYPSLELRLAVSAWRTGR